MPNYEKLYHELFNAVTTAIEALKTAQMDAEERYISAEDTKEESGQA